MYRLWRKQNQPAKNFKIRDAPQKSSAVNKESRSVTSNLEQTHNLRDETELSKGIRH